MEYPTPKISEAIASIMGQVRRLEKEHKNDFAKFRYTSVDDFKDHLRPIMSEHGISVHMNEVYFERLPTSAKDKYDAQFQFDIRLVHVSGEVGPVSHVTVALPFVGAQTTGQARSYALKEYLKTAFLASSGDSEDADQPLEGQELTKAEARDLFGKLDAEFNEAEEDGAKALKEWAYKRAPSLKVLPKDWRLDFQRRYKEALILLADTGEDEPVEVSDYRTATNGGYVAPDFDNLPE